MVPLVANSLAARGVSLAMTRRRSARMSGCPMWPGGSLARWSAGLAVVAMLVAAPVTVSRAQAGSSRPGSGALDGLMPAAAPMGWNHFDVPVSDGVATLGFPPQFAPFAGDRGTASATVRDHDRPDSCVPQRHPSARGRTTARLRGVPRPSSRGRA